MSCGHAHTVGLLPVLGEFSITSYNRGFPALCPLDSIGNAIPFLPTRRRVSLLRIVRPFA